MDISTIEALTFDVFGTVVDWRGTIIREGSRIGAEKGISADWAEFADAWRGGYEPAMRRVRLGERPWEKIDAPSPGDTRWTSGQARPLRPDRAREGRPQPRVAPPRSVARGRRRPRAAAKPVRRCVAVQRKHGPAHQHGQERRAAVGLRPLGGAGETVQARPVRLPDRRRSAGTSRRSA